MAIPGDPMCGLHVVRKGHGHQAIYNFVEEAETGHRSSLFKGLPVQLRLQKLLITIGSLMKVESIAECLEHSGILLTCIKH